MTPVELQDIAKRQPFQPFRVHVTTGETLDVYHPDLIMVGRRSVVIGVAKDKQQKLYDRTITVDLLHVVAVEHLPGKAKSSANGPGQGSGS